MESRKIEIASQAVLYNEISDTRYDIKMDTVTIHLSLLNKNIELKLLISMKKHAEIIMILL